MTVYKAVIYWNIADDDRLSDLRWQNTKTSDDVSTYIGWKRAYYKGRRCLGLEVNGCKTEYMVMSRDQNAGRCHSIKYDNSCFERVEEFKYLGTTLTL